MRSISLLSSNLKMRQEILRSPAARRNPPPANVMWATPFIAASPSTR